MRIVLRHNRSGLFLEKLGQWRCDPSAAQTFSTAIQALHFSAYYRLEAEVELIQESGDLQERAQFPKKAAWHEENRWAEMPETNMFRFRHDR